MLIIRKTGLLLTAIIIALLAMPSYVCLAAPAMIEVNGGSTITLDPGGSTNASLTVSGIPDPGLAAYTIRLSWNNS
ncbi:MAG: hypothetical protein ABH934_03675, partial [Chloroflexota bacterium]